MNFIDENGTEWTFDKEFGLGVKAPEFMRKEKEEKIKLYMVRLNRLNKQLKVLSNLFIGYVDSCILKMIVSTRSVKYSNTIESTKILLIFMISFMPI